MRRELTYATVCSGVECMSAAAIGLPLRPVFFSEIEPFPCAVLKHRFPHVPNLGDMSKIHINEKGEITNGRTTVALPAGGLDILAGGTPCQDVSNAGKRRGMQEGSGTRSSLAFEFVRLIRELRPRYVVWENVAGVLSDESFPKFLLAIADCGYGVAYRTLDAQYVRCADIDLPDGGVVRLERAVPQRRRRVWVVGCAGEDIGRASEILFEPQGVCGDRPPRRVTGQGTAEVARGRARLPDGVVGRASGFDPYEPGGVKSLNTGHAGTLINGSCPGCHSGVVEVYENHAQDCRVKPCGEVAPTLNGKMGTGGNNVPLKAECFVKVSHARGADGLGERWERGECAGTRNAIEGGDGRSQECVVLTNSNGEDVMPTLSRDCRSTGNQIEKNGGYVLERRVLSCGEGASPSPAAATGNEASVAVNVLGVFDMGARKAGAGTDTSGVSPTVLAQRGTDPHAVCLGFKSKSSEKTRGIGEEREVSPTVTTQFDGAVCFGVNANGVTKTAQMPCREECAETLAVRHQGGVLVPNVASMRYVVRRLTPTECERLMGLPDGWTLPAFAPDEITDALVAEFVEISDTFGAVMAGYSGKKPPKPKTAAWVRKWLERVANPAICPDALRYKSCGNGWATNQPRWILLRVLAKEGSTRGIPNHKEMKMKKKEKIIENLSDWEWTTLVAAWRYYERRATIASAMFPEDVVRRFWGSGKYSDAVLRQIANQFANIDHGRDGESYWTKDRTIGDCDRKSWCVFYAFCKGWCEGFTTVVLDATLADGQHLHQEPACFWCEYTGKWHPVDEYIRNPHYHRWCAEEFIKEIRK